jgi:phospholipid/cholesterol/gamma-HCH transport system permease protein
MEQTIRGESNKWLTTIGNQVLFMGSFIRNALKRGFEWNEFIRQCYSIGYRSLPLVGITGFVIGLVMTIQSYPTLKSLGAQGYVPSMVAISVVREIGPVVIALICAGKIASGIGAELGSMSVTEQIDAMEVSGASPLQYLVVTRILACTVMLPILTLMGDALAIMGGFIGENINGGISMVLYVNKAFGYMYLSDLFPAIIKSVFFGFAIGFIGCYKGYHTSKGTEGVGDAANSAVVTASLWIIIIDALAAQLTNIFVYQQ